MGTHLTCAKKTLPNINYNQGIFFLYIWALFIFHKKLIMFISGFYFLNFSRKHIIFLVGFQKETENIQNFHLSFEWKFEILFTKHFILFIFFWRLCTRANSIPTIISLQVWWVLQKSLSFAWLQKDHYKILDQIKLSVIRSLFKIIT